MFVLLLHHGQQASLDVPFTMESQSQESVIVDIKSPLANYPQEPFTSPFHIRMSKHKVAALPPKNKTALGQNGNGHLPLAWDTEYIG